MNNKTVAFLIFMVGTAIGSMATLHYLKKKYEQIAQEEIDSVKEVFPKKETPKEVDVIIETAEYVAELQKNGYTKYSNSDDTQAHNTLINAVPYVIPPEDFGEVGYDKIGLSYYADQILADENDELVENVEATVGFESLNHFGEFEDDSVFVRNDRLGCDYEILLDRRKYSDVVKARPYLRED